MAHPTPTPASGVAARAALLAEMHRGTAMLVLPTVWDVWSAKAAADAGFAALTIGSHPLANSRGQQDNEGMTLTDALDGIARICAAVDIPVSADVESGYDTPAKELVDRVLEAGAAGINVEDTVHSQNRVRSVNEHADYIGRIRVAADDAGVELVINARTDALLHGTDKFADPLQEAVDRLKACEKAGARSVYPVKIPDAASLQVLLRELTVPVNVTVNPRTGAPSGSLRQLQEMGVRRVTNGPLLQQELAASLTSLLTPWK